MELQKQRLFINFHSKNSENFFCTDEPTKAENIPGFKSKNEL